MSGREPSDRAGLARFHALRVPERPDRVPLGPLHGLGSSRAPLIPIALAFVTGIAVESALPVRAWWIAWLAGLVMTVLAGVVAGRHAAFAALLPAVLALGALRAVPAPLSADHVSHVGLPATADIEARVLADPVLFAPDRQRVLVEVERVDGVVRSGRMHLTVYGKAPDMQEGTRVAGEARLREASGFRNPDGFDYAAFLAREQVHVVATAVASRVRVMEDDRPWHARIRRHARDAMGAVLPPASAALLGGLLLGARTDLPPEILNGFRRAGVFHVLAVSGLHVGLVAGAVFTVVLVTGRSRLTASVLAMLAISGYAAVVGPRPSVLRALIMGLLVLAALLLEREASVVNSLALAAIIILAWRPGDLFNPGFQLSFAATAAIVLAPVPRRALAGSVVVSLAAQIATLPITLAHFNQFSTVGTVANLGVVPLAAVATVAGFTAVVLTAVSETLAGWAFDFVWPVLLGMRALVWLAASIPGALVYLPSPRGSALALYGLALAIGLAAWHARAARPRASLAAGASAAALLCGAIGIMLWPVLTPGDGRLRITVLDVGQADAVVVETPDRQTVVIAGALGGGGRFDLGERVVAPFLWNRGILALEALITTQDGPDDGIATLRRLFHVRSAFVPAEPGPRWVGPVAISLVGLGAPASSDGGASLAAVRLDYRLATFVLLFDISEAAERALAASGRDLRATVLKVPRHGARRTASPALLAAVRPSVAIVSTSARHPGSAHPETVARLADAGAAVYRTDQDGAVIVETDGRVLDVTRWAARRSDRYCLDPEAPCTPHHRGLPLPGLLM